MPAFMKELIEKLLGNASGIKGYILKKLLEYGGRYLLDIWEKIVRSQKQKAAEAKVKKDIEEGKARDEETRKNELDNINS